MWNELKHPIDASVVFKDGFSMTYQEFWDLGKPSERQHHELCKSLMREHGEPKILRGV
jgi:hypothetical protein